jgi:hypothetical protein
VQGPESPDKIQEKAFAVVAYSFLVFLFTNYTKKIKRNKWKIVQIDKTIQLHKNVMLIRTTTRISISQTVRQSVRKSGSLRQRSREACDVQWPTATTTGALHRTTLHQTAPHRTPPPTTPLCTAPHRYGQLQHSTAQHSTAQHSTAQHSTAQYSTVQYSTVQYSTVQYSTV